MANNEETSKEEYKVLSDSEINSMLTPKQLYTILLQCLEGMFINKMEIATCMKVMCDHGIITTAEDLQKDREEVYDDYPSIRESLNVVHNQMKMIGMDDIIHNYPFIESDE